MGVATGLDDTIDVASRLEHTLAAARTLTRVVSIALAEERTREDQWRIMRALATTGGLTMSALAEQVGIPAPSATRVVEELVSHSLAFRRQSERDARRVAVHLSRLGAEKLTRLDALIAAHASELESALITIRRVAGAADD